MTDGKDDRVLELTAHIVAAYVEKNPVPSAGLPDLIASISASIVGLGVPEVEPAPIQQPAVNPKKSVTAEFITCLEDERFKSLKRHPEQRPQNVPDEYRAKWNLAGDYPMVAPNYAAQRSAMAKEMGLGRKVEEKKPVKQSRRKAAAPLKARRARKA